MSRGKNWPKKLSVGARREVFNSGISLSDILVWYGNGLFIVIIKSIAVCIETFMRILISPSHLVLAKNKAETRRLSCSWCATW